MVHVKQAVGSANAKIILMGEHAVVYDAYAIALPFLTTQVKVKLSAGHHTIDSILYTGNLNQAPKQLNGLIALLEALKQRYDDSLDYHLEVISEIPMQRGMGSSAALANALIDAYGSYHDLAISFTDKFELSMIAETINHGRPSGIDSLTTMSKNPIYFKKGPDYESFSMDFDGYLVVVDSEIQGETLDAVQHVADHMHLEVTKARIAALDELSQLSKMALTNNHFDRLGQYMNQAHHHLDQLGVSHPLVNEMVALAQAHGASGAKMSGGGRGGVMISLLKTKTQVDTMLQAFEAAGFKHYWIMNLREAFQ